MRAFARAQRSIGPTSRFSSRAPLRRLARAGDQALALAESVGKADRQVAQSRGPLPLPRREAETEAAPSRSRSRRASTPSPWDALVAWGRARRPELVARGLRGLLRVAPMRSAEVEAGAVDSSGGTLALARRVAAAVADAPADLGVMKCA